MAKYAEILCGTLKTQWKALKIMLLHYKKMDVPPILTLDEGELVSMSLVECLITKRSCKCSCSSDKMYAVLGLAHDTTHFEANFDIFSCCSEIEKMLELWAHQGNTWTPKWEIVLILTIIHKDIIDFGHVCNIGTKQLRTTLASRYGSSPRFDFIFTLSSSLAGWQEWCSWRLGKCGSLGREERASEGIGFGALKLICG